MAPNLTEGEFMSRHLRRRIYPNIRDPQRISRTTGLDSLTTPLVRLGMKHGSKPYRDGAEPRRRTIGSSSVGSRLLSFGLRFDGGLALLMTTTFFQVERQLNGDAGLHAWPFYPASQVSGHNRPAVKLD